MEALTDGIIAIVATILVLEIKVPKLPEHYTQADIMLLFFMFMPAIDVMEDMSENA